MSLPQIGLTIIHKILADPILYTGVGVLAKPITATHSDVPAEAFPGPGKTARHVSFEIQRGDLPAKPSKGDQITHSTGLWKVIEVDGDRSVNAWIVSVAETA